MRPIQLRNVAKRFGDTAVLNEINLTIEPREFCVFVGPSGCGKSTLMRLIAGLEEVTSGQIEIDGAVVNDVPPSKRNVAMVFQSYALYPHMTAYENIAFGLRHLKLARGEIERRVAEASRVLRLEQLLGRKPRALSGGERQRVAIGRAIVRQPKVFLFDEPLSNLDAALRVQTRVEIAKLHRRLESSTTIYVTHDQTEAMTLGDKIVLLRPVGRDGAQESIAQVGDPLALYHHPANRFVAGFIGSPSMNFLPGTVARADERGIELTLPGMTCMALVSAAGLETGEPATLGIRPEHVEVGGGPYAGSVTHIERLGEHSYVHMTLNDVLPPLVAKTQRSDIAEGDRLAFSISAGATYLFRADGSAQRRLPSGNGLPAGERSPRKAS